MIMYQLVIGHAARCTN